MYSLGSCANTSRWSGLPPAAPGAAWLGPSAPLLLGALPPALPRMAALPPLPRMAAALPAMEAPWPLAALLPGTAPAAPAAAAAVPLGAPPGDVAAAAAAAVRGWPVGRQAALARIGLPKPGAGSCRPPPLPLLSRPASGPWGAPPPSPPATRPPPPSAAASFAAPPGARALLAAATPAAAAVGRPPAGASRRAGRLSRADAPAGLLLLALPLGLSSAAAGGLPLRLVWMDLPRLGHESRLPLKGGEQAPLPARPNRLSRSVDATRRGRPGTGGTVPSLASTAAMAA